MIGSSLALLATVVEALPPDARIIQRATPNRSRWQPSS